MSMPGRGLQVALGCGFSQLPRSLRYNPDVVPLEYETWPNGSYISIEAAEAAGTLDNVRLAVPTAPFRCGHRSHATRSHSLLVAPHWHCARGLRVWQSLVCWFECVACGVVLLSTWHDPWQLRMTLLYNLPNLATPDDGPYAHCRDVGYGCAAEDIITPGNTRYNQIKLRLDWAAAWIGENIWVKPTTVRGGHAQCLCKSWLCCSETRHIPGALAVTVPRHCRECD